MGQLGSQLERQADKRHQPEKNTVADTKAQPKQAVQPKQAAQPETWGKSNPVAEPKEATLPKQAAQPKLAAQPKPASSTSNAHQAVHQSGVGSSSGANLCAIRSRMGHEGVVTPLRRNVMHEPC